MNPQTTEHRRVPPPSFGQDSAHGITEVDPAPGDGVASTSNVQLPDHGPDNGVANTSHVRLVGASQPATERGLPFPPEDPLEGGRDGWLAVIGGSLVLCVSLGLVQSFGVFQDYYKRITLTERSPSEISWIGSTQSFFHFAIGLPAGLLFDKGYFYTCLTGGSVLYLVSFFLLSLARPHHYYQHLLAQGFGMGIGMGLMAFPALAVIAHYFVRRRSLAMGIVVAGSSVGGVFYPILLNNLFVNLGFGWGVRTVAFINFALLLLANFFIKRRHAHYELPASIGLKRVLLDWPFMLFVAGAWLVLWGLFFPCKLRHDLVNKHFVTLFRVSSVFYLQFYAARHHVKLSLVKYSLTIMNAASILGRILPNFLADKYGMFNVMIPLTIISGALIFGMFGAGTTGGLVAFALFYGFFSGGFVALCTPIASLFAAELSDIGIRIGIVSLGLGLSLLTGNPIAGALLAPPHYTWWRSIIFSSVCFRTTFRVS
ncbi:hypothetical protein HGRIS_014065 [Hohenbuehelia grisea]|uniref:Major facilitator superfamily (MFS) profile domain-containing protein n=1 Tax=Hohenbuehelia grisea TaxID=104357 RepID=A0ABR3JSI8_9AGAR